MKKEIISNEVLAGLVVVAAFISLGGTFMIFNGIQDVEYDVSYGGISGSITGFAAGTANVTVPASVAISLPVNTINFGNVGVNATANTTTDSPNPFIIQNDGSTNVNITIGATALFTGTGGANPSNHYRFMSAEEEVGSVVDDANDLVTSWTDMPDTGSAVKFANQLEFASGSDSLEGEILVTVPGDESAGSKASTVTFTATQS